MTRLDVRSAALLAACVAALSACGDPRREPERLRVSARSGARVDLSRTTWEACLPDTPGAGQSQRARIVHGDEGVVSYGFQDFAGPGCTGPAGEPRSLSFLGFVEAEGEVGWKGAPPPDAPATPLGTKVFLEGIALGRDTFWVDDLSTPRVLYAGAATSQLDPEGFPIELSPAGYIELP